LLFQIVGAEIGCQLQTCTGLYLGMPQEEAITIVNRDYKRNQKSISDQSVFIDQIDSTCQTQLGLCFVSYLLDFVGLYLKNLPD